MNTKKDIGNKHKHKFKLFETFAGIGSQHKALSNIGCDVELVGIAEWDINSMSAYNKIHNKNYEFEKEKLLNEVKGELINLKKEINDNEIKNHIIDKVKKLQNENGYVFSNDTKTPIKNLNTIKLEKLLDFYLATLSLNNITSVTILKDNVLNIKNTDIFTYSFPCQAISLQGKQEGLIEDSGTSSSLLWSIRDYLKAVYEEKNKKSINKFNETVELPKYLLMENVAALYNQKNSGEWNKFKDFLTSIGYETGEVVLKASNFGIPQNRDRAFALSVLKEDKNKDAILKKFKDLEIMKKPLNMIRAFLDENIDLNKAKELNLLIEEEYQVQKDKFNNPSLKATKNHIKKIILENYTTFQSENMVYHSDESVSPTITAQGAQSRIKIYDKKNDCIRYMTAEEHLKLMGFDSVDYKNLTKDNDFLNKNLIKKMAGNSIVVNVLEEIFKTLI